ncbi:MAG: flagellar biosynthetic protein FliO [Rhodospirillales bacterium]|nr:flagellar biosynthetic protein FliO [Rhodospirillales bacterium]
MTGPPAAMDLDVYFKFVLALVFVLGLIGALAWAARRFGLGGKLTHNTGRARRLAVVEVMPLDARRKLVLLRRDAAEHLVLLGAGPDLLVESGIAAPETPGPGEAPTEERPGGRTGEPA